MQTEKLNVSGMTCGGCTSSVTKALKLIPGVDDVSVSLETGEASVIFDEKLTSRNQLESAVTGAGFGVDASSSSRTPQIKGGCCK